MIVFLRLFETQILTEMPNIWEPEENWGKKYSFGTDVKEGLHYYTYGERAGWYFCQDSEVIAYVEGWSPHPSSEYWIFKTAWTDPKARGSGLMTKLVTKMMENYCFVLVDNEISQPMLNLLQKGAGKLWELYLHIEGYDPLVGDSDDIIMMTMRGFSREDAESIVQYEWDEEDEYYD